MKKPNKMDKKPAGGATVQRIVRRGYRTDAKRDQDGDCSVCGLPWPDRAETLERHKCPPGFVTPNG